MSSLTEEQRRRMEENRRKALEKRAAAAARTTAPATGQTSGVFAVPQSNNANKVATSSTSVSIPSVNRSTSEVSGSKVFRPSAPSSNAQNSVNVGGGGAAAVTSNAAFSKPAAVQPQPPQMPAGFTGRTVAGSCVMIARDRFLVDIGYHAQLISIFRNIQGHKYDATTRKWTFPTSEHSALIAAVACLRPNVCIGPLPPYVQRIFREVKPGVPRTIPFIDLSSVDSTLVKALMPFQREGVCFGISRNGRCLISDDMGLGKSIQALGIAHYYHQEWPLLIVCPSSMRYAWRESIWNWLPSVSAGAIAVIETGKDSVENARVLITSYDMLGRRSEEFSKCGVVIMDESHHLKNPKTARCKAAIPLMEKARRLILLSGTPALSRPIELFSQITAIKRNLFPSINDFGVRYCAGKKNAWGWDFSGSSNMEELQLILEETIMIRRLKSDVLQQLPAKLRKVMVLDPTLVKTKNNKSLKATAAAFNAGKNMKAMERRGKLLEYYSETAIAKLDAVTTYLKELIEDGKKFICFAHHKSMMEGISTVLENMKTKYIKIDGSTSAEDRQLAVDIFQTHDDVPVALLSITAANSGITLTAAKLVIFAELYWNPGILVQAEDRAHRIGQMDSVLVEYLVAGGTADDVLWPMIQEKLKVLNKAGLSKDNFGEADTTALVQRNGGGLPQQSKLDDFLMMSQDDETDGGAMEECKELENDQQLLDQLLDESFN